MSVVPTPFTSSDEAIAWCDANVPPVDECLARLVTDGLERSKAVVRG